MRGQLKPKAQKPKSVLDKAQLFKAKSFQSYARFPNLTTTELVVSLALLLMDPAYLQPAAQNHTNMYQQQQQQQHQYQPPPSLLSQPYPSSPYPTNPYPNPNPNPNPITLPAAAAAAAAAASDALRPPGVAAYTHDPYAASGVAVDGAQSVAAQQYADYYYHQLYAANPLAYGIVLTGNTTLDLETKKRKIIEGGTRADSVRVCSLCNIVCNSEKVFASHLAGEKHALKAQGMTSNGLKPKVPTHIKALHLTKKAKTPRPKAAAKKASTGLITFVQSSYCDVCKIDCNSQEVFNSHKVGKKHLKNLQKLSRTPQTTYCDVCKTDCTTQEVLSKHRSGKKHIKNLQKAQDSITPKPTNDTAKKDLIGPIQPAHCDVCKIDCNTQEVLDKHKLGKKHIKNLKKFQDSITPNKENAPAVKLAEKDATVDEGNKLNEQPKQSAPKPKEDLDTKKQKVLSGGAAADSVKICTHCNVICNSETVYKFHIAGKKHNAVIKQQQIAPVTC